MDGDEEERACQGTTTKIDKKKGSYKDNKKVSFFVLSLAISGGNGVPDFRKRDGKGTAENRQW